MNGVRNAHAAAAAINGLALAAGFLGRPGIAVALLTASMFLLIWGLERLRIAAARENAR